MATQADVALAPGAEGIEDNPADAVEAPATVAIASARREAFLLDSRVAEAPTLTPTTLTAILKPGESVAEHKIGYVPGAPPVGELMFVLDLTGSMGGELANAKANSINIMNAIAGVIPNTRFGVISHMDYTGYYGGCGYSRRYGSESYGDY